MAAPIGPGDFVECVDVRPSLRFAPPALRLGAIYCVEGIEPECFCSLCGRCAGLVLLGYAPQPGARAAKACRFRPIYRPNADFIESLKAPPKSAPVRESEDA